MGTESTAIPNGRDWPRNARNAASGSAFPRRGISRPHRRVQEALPPPPAAESPRRPRPRARNPLSARAGRLPPDQIEFLCPNNHLIHAPACSRGSRASAPSAAPSSTCRPTTNLRRKKGRDDPALDQALLESISFGVPGGSSVIIEGLHPFEEPQCRDRPARPRARPPEPAGRTAGRRPCTRPRRRRRRDDGRAGGVVFWPVLPALDPSGGRGCEHRDPLWPVAEPDPGPVLQAALDRQPRRVRHGRAGRDLYRDA